MIINRKISVQTVIALLAMFAAAVLIAAMPSPAAALSWSLPVVNLSTPGEDIVANDQQVAVAADGTTTVAWLRWTSIYEYSVLVRTRPAGSNTFRAAENLSGLRSGVLGEVPFEMAVAADGTTTVVWYGDYGSNYAVQTRTRPAGSNTFNALENLYVAALDTYQPQVAVAAADGATTVVWSMFASSIQARTRPAESNTFGAVENISAAGQSAGEPRIAVAADGVTTVAWISFDNFTPIIQTRTRPAGSTTFGNIENLSPSGDGVENPGVAAGANGTTTVVWDRNEGSHFSVQARTRPAGSSSFSAAEKLSTAGQWSSGAEVAIAADGATTVAWSRGDSSSIGDILETRTRPAGSSSFGAVQKMVGSGRNTGGWQIAVAANGTTTVVFSSRSTHPRNDEVIIVQVRTRPAGSSTFSKPVTLSPAGQEFYGPQVAIAANGVTTVVWNTSVGARVGIIQARTSGSGGSFTVRSVKASRLALTSSVAVPGPGKLTQRVTRKSRGATLTVCKTSGQVTKAGTVKLTCKLSSATRAALRKRSLRVSVKTTFTPTGGLPAHKTQTVTLKRKR